ncbi:MAG: hypothetical protein SFT90_08450 [Rickettsiales bacterium]|nr:hypothetical protein [Rickettsiales bacterium]
MENNLVVIFYNQLKKVHDWDSFVHFFEIQSFPMQIVIGLTLFGIAYLVFLFFYAMFVDKHN